MDKIAIMYLIGAAVSNAVANSLIKIGFGGNLNLFSDGIIKGLFKAATNPYIFFGAAVFGVSLLLFGSALGRANLSLAYPFMSGLAFLLIFLVSVLFFKEAVNIWGLLGIFSILTGIILISVKA